MVFLEKDLEDIIYEADQDSLLDRGLYVCRNKYRQLRIGNYGIADMVTFRKGAYIGNGMREPSEITVYELKKDKIGLSTVMQAIKYVKGISRYLEYRSSDLEYYFSIVLIGKSIENSNMLYLTDYLENYQHERFLSYYTYNYELDGIRFHQKCNYKLTNEGFNHGKTTKK